MAGRLKRWRLIRSDAAPIVVGLLAVLFGWWLTKYFVQEPERAFWANAALTAGISVILVGFVLRLQLDIQDELDLAQQARRTFEAEITRRIDMVDKRLEEAVAELPTRSDLRRHDQVRDLIDELHLARSKVADLERKLEESRRPRVRQSRVLSAVFGARGADSDDQPTSQEHSRDNLMVRRAFLVFFAGLVAVRRKFASWLQRNAALAGRSVLSAGMGMAASALLGAVSPMTRRVIYPHGFVHLLTFSQELGVLVTVTAFTHLNKSALRRRVALLLVVALVVQAAAIGAGLSFSRQPRRAPVAGGSEVPTRVNPDRDGDSDHND